MTVKDICLVAKKISAESRSNLRQKESQLRIEMTDKVDLEVIEAFKLFDKVGVRYLKYSEVISNQNFKLVEIKRLLKLKSLAIHF